MRSKESGSAILGLLYLVLYLGAIGWYLSIPQPVYSFVVLGLHQGIFLLLIVVALLFKRAEKLERLAQLFPKLFIQGTIIAVAFAGWSTYQSEHMQYGSATVPVAVRLNIEKGEQRIKELSRTVKQYQKKKRRLEKKLASTSSQAQPKTQKKIRALLKRFQEKERQLTMTINRIRDSIESIKIQAEGEIKHFDKQDQALIRHLEVSDEVLTEMDSMNEDDRNLEDSL